MKRFFKACALIAACAMAFTICACAPEIDGPTTYEVATQLGYEGSESAWLAAQSEKSTVVRRMYEEAVSDGYSGSYVEFIKEIGYSSDSAFAVQNALISSVMVSATFYRSRSIEGTTAVGQAFKSEGAGVIYSLNAEAGNAYVITNYHVIYNVDSAGNETIAHVSDEIDLYLYGDTLGKRPIRATFLGGAMDHDIAVLSVENSDEMKSGSVRAIVAADSDGISVGDRVYAVGNPNLAGMSAVSGIVSVEAEYLKVVRPDNTKSVQMLEIRTDAPINHGNSGGGLFNADGELIGIVNARSEASGVEHFGYAIPANLAIAVAQNIIDNSKINTSRGAFRATLGVTIETTDARSVYDEATGKAYLTETLCVAAVEGRSAAYGKLEVGDVFYSVRLNGGRERILNKLRELTVALFEIRMGGVATFVVSRNGTPVSVDITFDEGRYFTFMS